MHTPMPFRHTSDGLDHAPARRARDGARRGSLAPAHPAHASITRVWAMPLLVLVMLMQAACGSSAERRGAVLAFAEASAHLAQVAAAEFRQSREDVIAMNRMRVRLGDSTMTPAALEGNLTADRVTTRVLAVEALATYAELLRTLATSNQREQISAATLKFTSALKATPRVDLSNSQLGAIGAAVNALGGIAIEAMRERALREVVPKTHGAVISLVNLLKEDFDPEGEHWTLGYDVTTVALEGAATLAAAREPQLVHEARMLAATNQQRVQALAPKLVEACDALLSAQTNLNYAVQSRELSIAEIELYVGKVTQLSALYKVLRREF